MKKQSKTYYTVIYMDTDNKKQTIDIYGSNQGVVLKKFDATIANCKELLKVRKGG